MGLNCSHDAFHGAYSAFNSFRQAVAAATGGSFPPHYVYENGDVSWDDNTGLLKRHADLDERRWYWGDDYSAETHPGLYILFMHSDFGGEISPEDCVLVANDLEAALPRIASLGWHPYGHIALGGGYVAVTKKFIAGCRAAAEEGVPLTFG